MSAAGRTAPLGVLLLALALGIGGCGEGDPLQSRLHRAQRDYWQARRDQERLDIYPGRALAEECLARYAALAAANPLSALPDSVGDSEAVAVKLARVGSMAAQGAASIYWELGQRETAVALLQAELRDDLPLGSLVERRLRVTLAGYLRESGRPAEALDVYASLLHPLRAGLEPGDAAYPDAELLALPPQMVELARAHGDPRLLEATGELLADYFGRLAADYTGREPGYQGLLVWTDMATRLGRWKDAEDALTHLAADYPAREPWRAELRRARLLADHLGKPAACEAIIRRWSEGDDHAASVAAGMELVRFLLARDRLAEVAPELALLRARVSGREERAELLYLRGRYEARRGAWDVARQRWGEAAAEMPYTGFGMRSQLAVAQIWADRHEPRFAARALERLYEACRRNARNAPGSELADVSLGLEAKADSLLGTLPATDATVSALRARRHPARDDS